MNLYDLSGWKLIINECMYVLIKSSIRMVEVTVYIRGCPPGNLFYAHCFKIKPGKLYINVKLVK